MQYVSFNSRRRPPPSLKDVTPTSRTHMRQLLVREQCLQREEKLSCHHHSNKQQLSNRLYPMATATIAISKDSVTKAIAFLATILHLATFLASPASITGRYQAQTSHSIPCTTTSQRGRSLPTQGCKPAAPISAGGRRCRHRCRRSRWNNDDYRPQNVVFLECTRGEVA